MRVLFVLSKWAPECCSDKCSCHTYLSTCICRVVYNSTPAYSSWYCLLFAEWYSLHCHATFHTYLWSVPRDHLFLTSCFGQCDLLPHQGSIPAERRQSKLSLEQVGSWLAVWPWPGGQAFSILPPWPRVWLGLSIGFQCVKIAMKQLMLFWALSKSVFHWPFKFDCFLFIWLQSSSWWHSFQPCTASVVFFHHGQANFFTLYLGLLLHFSSEFWTWLQRTMPLMTRFTTSTRG